MWQKLAVSRQPWVWRETATRELVVRRRVQP
jgi:hypothetical protein